MPLTEGLEETTVCFGLESFFPEELMRSLSLFSMTSMFHFLTQICLMVSGLFSAMNVFGVEYSPLRTGCLPGFSKTRNSTSGYCLAKPASLSRKKSLMPLDEPPKLQYVIVMRLHGRTKAPTPLRARETCCKTLIPTMFDEIYVV